MTSDTLILVYNEDTDSIVIEKDDNGIMEFLASQDYQTHNGRKLLNTFPSFINNIKNPSDALIREYEQYIIISRENIHLISENELKCRISHNPDIFLMLEDPSKELCNAVIASNPLYIGRIKNPSMEQIVAAIRVNPFAINQLVIDDLPIELLVCAFVLDNKALDAYILGHDASRLLSLGIDSITGRVEHVIENREEYMEFMLDIMPG